MKRISIIVAVILVTLFFPRIVSAGESKLACSEKYLTLVNPVRGRDLWVDKSISPLTNQYQEIVSYEFSATWLLQYDALVDWGIYDTLQTFNNDQELGLFLEVSPGLANASRVVYPHMVAWNDPNAIFLSGYTQSERRKLIDTLFKEFKDKFGYYPRSVGAWWVDSYSLGYMKSKYDISAVMIVADQKTTDDYGVWGQWWGVPYFPSRANILIPASNKMNIQDVVVVQWAQRDLTKAYGEGPVVSNYSLQANDYTERGLDTKYFVSLLENYFDCKLPVGQITVGLETGMESVKSFPEYKKQLKTLSGIGGIKSVTLKDFFVEFSRVYGDKNPEKIILSDGISDWNLSLSGRRNDFLGDKIDYGTDLAFSDYFVPDSSTFLDRKLPIRHTGARDLPRFIFPLILFAIVYFILRKVGQVRYFFPLSLFVVASYLPLLSSFQQFGWSIYYGPQVNSIWIAQFLVVVLSLLLLTFLSSRYSSKVRNFGLLCYLTFLSYGLDFLVRRLRYTSLGGSRYFGFSIDAFRFVGLKLFKNSPSFVNKDFGAVVSSSMLRINFGKLYDHPIIYYILYPLLHVLIGIFLWLILRKLPGKIRLLVVVLLVLLFCMYIYIVFGIDPRAVV